MRSYYPSKLAKEVQQVGPEQNIHQIMVWNCLFYNVTFAGFEPTNCVQQASKSNQHDNEVQTVTYGPC